MSDSKVIARSFYKIDELTSKYHKPKEIAATLSLMFSVIKKVEFQGATPEDANYSCITAAAISYFEQKGLADKHNYTFLTKLNSHTDFASLEKEDKDYEQFMGTLYKFPNPANYREFPHECPSLFKVFEIQGADMVTKEYLRSEADSKEFSFNIDILVDKANNDAFILYDFNLQKKILKYYKIQMLIPEEKEENKIEEGGKSDYINQYNANFEAYSKALMDGDTESLRSIKSQMLSNLEKAKISIDKDDKKLISKDEEILALDCQKYLSPISTAISNLLKKLNTEYKLIDETQDKICYICCTSPNSSVYCFSTKKSDEFVCIRCLHSNIAKKYSKQSNQDAFKLMIYLELVEKDIREASKDKSKLI